MKKILFCIALALPIKAFSLPQGLLGGDGFGMDGIFHISSTTGHVTINSVSVITNAEVGGYVQQGEVKSCTLGLTTDSDGKINACVASDQSLKKDVMELSIDLNIIERLRPVNYKWIDEQGRDAQLHAGFIAQEVESVFPEAVVSAGEGLKGIDQSALNALIIKALQEIRAQLDPAGKK